MESEQTRSKIRGGGPWHWRAERRDWWLPCAGCFQRFRAPGPAHYCANCLAAMAEADKYACDRCGEPEHPEDGAFRDNMETFLCRACVPTD